MYKMVKCFDILRYDIIQYLICYVSVVLDNNSIYLSRIFVMLGIVPYRYYKYHLHIDSSVKINSAKLILVTINFQPQVPSSDNINKALAKYFVK